MITHSSSLPALASVFLLRSGLNWKAVVVWALAVFPSLPGFASTLSRGKIKTVSIGWVHTSYLAWPLGFAISFTLWIVLNRVLPPPGLGEVDETDVFGTFTDEELLVNKVVSSQGSGTSGLEGLGSARRAKSEEGDLEEGEVDEKRAA